MRVALSFPGCHRRGGVERVMLECANFLQSRGHEVHVYASDWDEELLHSEVVKHHVPTKAKNAIARMVRFSSLAQRELQNTQPPIQVSGTHGCVCPTGGVAWAHSVHRAWIEHSKAARGSFSVGRIKQSINPIHPILLKLEAKYFRKGNYQKIIAMTDQVKADLMRFYGVPDNDVVVVPNGFAPSEFNVGLRHEVRENMRRKLNYNSEQKVVVFTANELERKGFGPLLRAIAQLDDPRVCLLAVGRLNPDAYAAEIERLDMTQRVQFTGPTGEVANFYAAADLFALPTQYEAWGLVIVEAMACGLPVLTSRLAGAAIAVRENETGYLLHDPQNVEEIKQKLALLVEGQHASPEAISQSVEQYAWSQVLLRYESVLLECAAA
jgi:UDP-glucose:(heptosyl)LPS alpha-1,3-glucosyltransferase